MNLRSREAKSKLFVATISIGIIFVLMFPSIGAHFSIAESFLFDQSANLVLGQSNFAMPGGVIPNGLAVPYDFGFDHKGNPLGS